MAKKERIFKITGPRVDGPKLHGPRIEGWKLKGPRLEGPHLHGPRISLTLHGRRTRAGIIATGILALAIYVDVSSDSGSTPSAGIAGTPKTSSSASGNPIPETFRVGGTHKLKKINAELDGSNGISFERVYEGGHATNEWFAAFEPGWPVFPNDKWVRDPLQPGAECKIEGAGMTVTNPRMVCDFTGNKGPAKNKLGKRGTAKR